MKIKINDLPEPLRQHLALTDETWPEVDLQLTEAELLAIDRLAAANGVERDVMLRGLISAGADRIGLSLPGQTDHSG